MSQPRTNSTGPGKIVEPGHLVTRLRQTSLLQQNTFRCSDRLDQDIEVSRSIWLAELGDWGHVAKRKGNKVSLRVVALVRRMLLRKQAANCQQFINQYCNFCLDINSYCVFSLSKTSEKIQMVWLKKKKKYLEQRGNSKNIDVKIYVLIKNGFYLHNSIKH